MHHLLQDRLGHSQGGSRRRGQAAIRQRIGQPPQAVLPLLPIRSLRSLKAQAVQAMQHNWWQGVNNGMGHPQTMERSVFLYRSHLARYSTMGSSSSSCMVPPSTWRTAARAPVAMSSVCMLLFSTVQKVGACRMTAAE